MDPYAHPKSIFKQIDSVFTISSKFGFNGGEKTAALRKCGAAETFDMIKD